MEKEGKITEGSATVSFPRGEVFYNPVQQFNRDLSIAVISTYARMYRPQKPICVLESLSASGLRSVRYAKEIPELGTIFTNDIDIGAFNTIAENIGANGVTEKVKPNNQDANMAAFTIRSGGAELDVIDLDPYGSAMPFLDSAMQNITNGGLLCVTFTDLAVLCASYPETCYGKYNSLPLKGDVCHEAALRIVLCNIENAANRYKKSIIPLLSCSIDFYVRLFVIVESSPAKVKQSARYCLSSYIFSKRSLVVRCVQCKSMEIQPIIRSHANASGVITKYTAPRIEFDQLCPLCGGAKEIVGPMWIAEMHDINFAKQVLGNVKGDAFPHFGTLSRIEGLLSVISEETSEPFFYSLAEASSFLKLSNPPLIKFRSALLNLGYTVSTSHTEPQSIKTNCPAKAFWAIMLEWAKQSSASLDKFDASSPQKKLMLTCSDFVKVDFTVRPDANPPSRSGSLKRFPENPTRNWGPMKKARTSKLN